MRDALNNLNALAYNPSLKIPFVSFYHGGLKDTERLEMVEEVIKNGGILIAIAEAIGVGLNAAHARRFILLSRVNYESRFDWSRLRGD